MSRLVLTQNDIASRVSQFLGEGSTPGTAHKDIVYRGLRNFYYPVDATTGQPHVWSFLKQHYAMSVINDVWKYALPEDFSEFASDITFDTGDGYPPVKEKLPEQIIKMRAGCDTSGYPQYYALVPVKYDNEVGTYYELWFYPNPDGTYLLQFFYKIDPTKPETSTDYLPGGVRATEAIIENCLAVAEQQEDDVAGLHTQLAVTKTQELIAHDKKSRTNRLGNLYRGEQEWPPARKTLTDSLTSDDVYS